MQRAVELGQDIDYRRMVLCSLPSVHDHFGGGMGVTANESLVTHGWCALSPISHLSLRRKFAKIHRNLQELRVEWHDTWWVWPTIPSCHSLSFLRLRFVRECVGACRIWALIGISESYEEWVMCSLIQWPVSFSLPWGLKRCKTASDIASTEHQAAHESVMYEISDVLRVPFFSLTLPWRRRRNLIGEHTLWDGDTYFCRIATQASTATLSRRLWSFTRPSMHLCTASRACTVAQGDVHLRTTWRITHHSIDHMLLDIQYHQRPSAQTASMASTAAQGNVFFRKRWRTSIAKEFGTSCDSSMMSVLTEYLCFERHNDICMYRFLCKILVLLPLFVAYAWEFVTPTWLTNAIQVQNDTLIQCFIHVATLLRRF